MQHVLMIFSRFFFKKKRKLFEAAREIENSKSQMLECLARRDRGWCKVNLFFFIKQKFQSIKKHKVEVFSFSVLIKKKLRSFNEQHRRIREQLVAKIHREIASSLLQERIFLQRSFSTHLEATTLKSGQKKYFSGKNFLQLLSLFLFLKSSAQNKFVENMNFSRISITLRVGSFFKIY